MYKNKKCHLLTYYPLTFSQFQKGMNTLLFHSFLRFYASNSLTIFASNVTDLT